MSDCVPQDDRGEVSRTSRCSTPRWKASSRRPPRPRRSAILQGNPDVNAAFSTTGNGIQTWSGAARKAGRDVVIIGMDYIRQNLDIVKSGAAYGIVAQPLYEESAKTAELLGALAEGKTVTYLNPLPASVITADGPRPRTTRCWTAPVSRPARRNPSRGPLAPRDDGEPTMQDSADARIRHRGDRRSSRAFPACRRCAASTSASARGRDPRAPRPERRRQVDAGQDPERRPPRRLLRRRNPPRRRVRSRFTSPWRRARQGHRLRAAGDRGLRAALGRRERLCRPDRPRPRA